MHARRQQAARAAMLAPATLALLTGVERRDAPRSVRIGDHHGLAVFGLALFYGDAMITPAISVLSRRRRAFRA
jgi:K+ transporter